MCSARAGMWGIRSDGQRPLAGVGAVVMHELLAGVVAHGIVVPQAQRGVDDEAVQQVARHEEPGFSAGVHATPGVEMFERCRSARDSCAWSGTQVPGQYAIRLQVQGV